MFRLVKDEVPQDVEDPEDEVFVPDPTHRMGGNRTIGGALCVACGAGEHNASGRGVLAKPCTIPQTRVGPSHDESHTVIPATWDPTNSEYAYLCERCGVTDRSPDTRKMLRLECPGRTDNPMARARIRQHSMKAVEREAQRAEAEEAARIAQRARRAAMKENVAKAFRPIKRTYDAVRTSHVFWVAFNIKGVILIYVLASTAWTQPASPAALAIAENIRNHPEEWISYNAAPFQNKKRGIVIPNGQAAPFVNATMRGTPVDGLSSGASFVHGTRSQRIVRDAIHEWHEDRKAETNAALLASLK